VGGPKRRILETPSTLDPHDIAAVIEGPSDVTGIKAAALNAQDGISASSRCLRSPQ